MGQRIEKMKKKKWMIPVMIVIIVALLVIGFVVFRHLRGGAEEDMGYMDGDGFIEDGGVMYGATNYYAGIVEAQETQEVQKDSSKEIDEVFVEVGSEVKKGDPLFSYKTDDLKLEIDKAKLSLENTATNITEYNNQIASYTAKMNETTDASIKAEYQLKITDIQNQIRQAQLEQRTTKADIDAKQKSIDNAVVKSTVDGVVKTISASSTDSGPYMTILGTGSYRVKGSVDEMNVGMLSEGMSVTIHSRVDKDQTWEGKITKIDTEDVNKNNNNNSSYYGDYGSSGSSESATKYSFYVELTSADGLLLGQHVYVEPSFEYSDVSDEAVEETVTEETTEETTEN